MNILVVGDDPSVRTLVKAILEHNGNHVITEDTVTGGKKAAIEGNSEMIILDLGLADGDGYELCKSIRDKNVKTPVLILSAEQEADVRVKCLRVDADDFLTKPFNTEELIARIEAMQRRTEVSGDQVLNCGELKVDLLKREFMINSEIIHLTNNELNLVVYFMQNKNKVITQEELAKKVWDIHFDTKTNYINVYISYLRKKIREHSDNEYIETIRKKGFTFRCG